MLSLNLLITIFFLVFAWRVAYAADDSVMANSEAQNQEAFPFDQPCLKFDKANFKTGPALLDLMTSGDFPQYCVLYSLSNYQVKEKNDQGYFIAGLKSGLQHPEATSVVLKSNHLYKLNQLLVSAGVGDSKPAGQWAYFLGTEEMAQDNGVEKEIYVFQEIDF